MKGKDDKPPDIKTNKWSIGAGALCAAAWFTALSWGRGPFDLGQFLQGTLSLAFFAFIWFTLGFVPAGLAAGAKGWEQKVSYAIIGLASNAALIWYIFFK